MIIHDTSSVIDSQPARQEVGEICNQLLRSMLKARIPTLMGSTQEPVYRQPLLPDQACSTDSVAEKATFMKAVKQN